MKDRRQEIKEYQEREEKVQAWVYGIMVVCILLTFVFMICDAMANVIILPDGTIMTCTTDEQGITQCV